MFGDALGAGAGAFRARGVPVEKSEAEQEEIDTEN
jgi:hypothetical protein